MPIAISRALLTAGAAAGLAVLATGTAAAHVVADAPGATQGGYAVVTFRVPTESDTAATTKLAVTLPGLSSARTEPIPGWTAKLDKNDKNQYVTVTWAADPGNPGIAPGQFQRFALSAGPLPKQKSVGFPATQTYSDGKVVTWNEPTGPDGKEPENPTPTLTLAASTASDDQAESTASPTTHDTDNTARWLGGIGLILGAFGAALGLGALIRSRQS
ncbi:YcnI family copper-binding membrane protein [Nocardia terpenica]|uniref:Nuclear export factor GLE1 n=1 Tax=Nocardia terpenica TaxID=455432 RepID=A0A291RC97_9NOCA|nr:YcnI family protein [Nocardia terpenica]ATL64917.1 nuclear export factor GLE1 [Nocardia terpenica]